MPSQAIGEDVDAFRRLRCRTWHKPTMRVCIGRLLGLYQLQATARVRL